MGIMIQRIRLTQRKSPVSTLSMIGPILTPPSKCQSLSLTTNTGSKYNLNYFYCLFLGYRQSIMFTIIRITIYKNKKN